MRATQSSLQDCYFYFYSYCTKGNECPFRHCELALGTETVCSLWREGRCFRSNCKFRHMENRINRSMIACYWENQPGGCRKPHCVFLHRKLRNAVQVIKDNPGLILPTSDGKTSPKHPDLNELSNLPNKVPLAEKSVENVYAPVPPLVLGFDEGEESDTESITSTPVKQGDKKAALTRNDLSVKASDAAEEKDFGIKTLEQIRMEKIHKESDSYYGAAYASTPLYVPRLIEQHYPPKAEFLALPKDSSLDKSSPAPITEPKLSGVDEETDLRGRLLSRRNALSNKVNQVKRLISFKRQNGNQVEVDSNKKLDFKIKTLAEIRRGKENKQSKSEVALDDSPDVLPSLEEKKPLNNTKQKTFRKLKINRKPKELYSVPAGHIYQDVAAPNRTKTTSNHLVSNGIKNISPKSSEESSEIPLLNKNSSDSSPGKRKSDDDSCPTASKVIKIATTSNDDCKQVNWGNACSDRIGENHVQPSPRSPEILSSSAAAEASDRSSHIHSSTSPSLTQDEIMVSQSSVPDIEMNGVVASTPASVSSSPSSCHRPDEKSGHASDENEHASKDETLNSSVLPTIRSDPISDDGARKDNLIDSSMSVDAQLDELLGDYDMNIDEMDANQNDDILLQIEEFLES